ncbi:MAG: alpha/beta hydrolase, partial [Rhodothermales bacterium]|nr:alpha/beta hydrolase [Rhodothermales bacterium]
MLTLLAAALTLLLAGCRYSGDPPQLEPPGTSVTITVDMGPAVEAGWFDPASEAVGLRGGFAPLSWGSSVSTRRLESSNRFRVTVQFPVGTPEVVPYKIKVEGEDNPNGGWEEGANRILRLDTEKVSVERTWEAPPDDVPSTVTGDVRVHESFGEGSGLAARALHVWLPPGYDDAPDHRYPVLYMHDGQNIFDVRGAGAEWRVDETARELIARGAVEPFIVVGVENTAARMEEYTPTVSTWQHMARRVADLDGENGEWAGRYAVENLPETDEAALLIRGAGDHLEARLPRDSVWVDVRHQEDGMLFEPRSGIRMEAIERTSGKVSWIRAFRPGTGGQGSAYAKFLVEQVKPFVDANYRTLSDREHTSVGGSSLGGLITLYLGATHPDTFGGLLVVSPTIWWNGRDILDVVRNRGYVDGQRIWLDTGLEEEEDMLAGARAARDLLDSLGWTPGDDLMYVEASGAGHNEGAWADRIDEMLLFL